MLSAFVVPGSFGETQQSNTNLDYRFKVQDRLAEQEFVQPCSHS